MGQKAINGPLAADKANSVAPRQILHGIVILITQAPHRLLPIGLREKAADQANRFHSRLYGPLDQFLIGRQEFVQRHMEGAFFPCREAPPHVVDTDHHEKMVRLFLEDVPLPAGSKVTDGVPADSFVYEVQGQVRPPCQSHGAELGHPTLPERRELTGAPGVGNAVSYEQEGVP